MDKDTSKGIEDYEDDKIEKKNKKNSENLGETLNEAKTNFIESKLEYHPNFFNINDSDFESKVFKNFLDYTNSTNKYNYLAVSELTGYSQLQKENISKQLKNEIISRKVSVDKNSHTLLSFYEKNYNFSNGNKEKLKLEIQKLRGLDILKLIKSDSERIKFIEKTKIDKEIIDNSDNIINGIDFKRIEKGLEAEKYTLPQEKAYVKFSTGDGQLSTSEYLQLLSVFNKNEQELFLLEYDINFSLSELIDKGILDKKQAILYLRKSYKEIYPDLPDSEIYKILNSGIDFTAVFISSKELSKGDLGKVLDNKRLLTSLFDELNDYKKNIEKSIKEDFYDNIEVTYDVNTKKPLIHDGFKQFLNSKTINEGKISSEILNSLNNFEEGGYLEFTKNGKTYYSYIEEIDVGGTKAGKHIVVKDLTDGTNTSKIRNPAYVGSKIMSYKDLYYILKNTSSDNKSSVNFISGDDFKSKNLVVSEEDDNIQTEEGLLEKLKVEGFLEGDLSGKKLEDLILFDKTNNKDKTYRNFSVKGNNVIFDKPNEKGTFSMFLSALKGNKSKYSFSEKIKSGNALLDKLGLDRDEYKIRGNKLYFNGKNNEKEIEVSYFEGKELAINIHYISDDHIEYTTGKIKKKKVKTGKKDKKGKDIEREEKEFKPNSEFYDTGFNNFLKDTHYDDGDEVVDLTPETSEAVENKSESSGLKQNKSFLKAWFSGMSLMEVIGSGKMIMDSIEDHFKLGNQLKSSKLAGKMSKFLPKSISVKLKTKQEEESKKLMDDIVGKILTELNGDEAYEYLKKEILYNPYVENYEVFAGMKFMLKKTGSLNAKGILGNRGEFIWYEKLGGRKGDALYEKTRKKAEEAALVKGGKPDPSFFTEEDLVEAKLKEMTVNGDIFSRADKDFAKYRAEGHENRHKKGIEEAGQNFTLAARTDYFVGHLANGEDDRALGALEKIMGKNKGDITTMNKAPFILAMGGFAKDYDGKNVGRLTGLAWESPYSSLYFASTKDGIDTYQSAIMKLFTDKGEKSKAVKLGEIIEMTGKTKDGKTKASELAKFWDENGKTIGNFLNFKDNEVLLKKGTDKDPDGVYQRLFDGMQVVYTDPEYNAKKDKFLETGMYEAHTGAAYTGFILDSDETSITTTHNLSYTGVHSKSVAKVIFNALEEIKANNKTTKEEKRKLFKMVFEPFEKRINSAVGALGDREGFDFNTSKGGIAKDFRKYNLLLNMEEQGDEEFMNNAFENFYNNSIGDESVGDETGKNKSKVSDIMEYSSPDYEPESVYDDGEKGEGAIYEAMKERKEYDKRKKEEEEKEYA